MIVEVVTSKECVGCGACSNVCANKAISMSFDNEGFMFPHTDIRLCNDCGLCNKVCPAINSSDVKHKRGDLYAAVSKNQEDLRNSSSGGIFSVIADYVLEKGGFVCGAAFDSGFILKHQVIGNKESLVKLRGSKYLQSDISGVFQEIKSYITQGRLVYFVGTSCQVAAIRLFLRKDFSNLITSDIVCHGVPSQKIFNSFLSYFERRHDVKVIEYLFRDKTIHGWSCTSSSFAIENKTGKQKYFGFDRTLNAYFKAFITGSINRECCYKCHYTTEERVSDISLADYWGVENFHRQFNVADGVSIMIVNTPWGKSILDDVRDRIEYVPSDFKYAEIINKCLYESTPRPPLRDKVYGTIDSDPDLIVEHFQEFAWGVAFWKHQLKCLLSKNKAIYKFLFNVKRKIFAR